MEKNNFYFLLTTWKQANKEDLDKRGGSMISKKGEEWQSEEHSGIMTFEDDHKGKMIETRQAFSTVNLCRRAILWYVGT